MFSWYILLALVLHTFNESDVPVDGFRSIVVVPKIATLLQQVRLQNQSLYRRSSIFTPLVQQFAIVTKRISNVRLYNSASELEIVDPYNDSSSSIIDVNNNLDDDDDDDDNDTTNDVTTLRSVTFSNLPKDQEPNLLCELLMEYGACATWITDAERYTDREEPIFHEPTTTTNLEDMLAIPWIAPVWNQCNVTALFPASIHIPTTISTICDIFTDIVAVVDDKDNDDESNALSSSASPLSVLETYSIETVPSNKDWVLSVQQSWHPIIVDNCNFVLRFPWHTDDDVNIAVTGHLNDRTDATTTFGSQDQKQQELIPILLQGGIAFGTGEHATTQLCLQWLHDNVNTLLDVRQQQQQQQQQQSIRVLDYGTGSGILGIAACAIGRSRQRKYMMSRNSSIITDDNVDLYPPLITAVGIDIDVDACRIANSNAINNGNVAMKSYLPPLFTNDQIHDDESQSLLMKAHYNQQQQQQTIDHNDVDDIVLKGKEGLDDTSFDLCVANILAGPLIVLSSTLYQYIKPGGIIGMSGILQHQGPMIVDAYETAGFVNVQIHAEMAGWILVTAQRPPC